MAKGLIHVKTIFSILFTSLISEPLDTKLKALFNPSQTINKLDNSHEIGKFDGKQIFSLIDQN